MACTDNHEEYLIAGHKARHRQTVSESCFPRATTNQKSRKSHCYVARHGVMYMYVI